MARLWTQDSGLGTRDSERSEVEERLAAAINPWLAHMTWRRDFEAWRERRIWQERYQGDNLRDLRQAFSGDLSDKRLLDLGAGMGGLSVALLLETRGEAGRSALTPNLSPLTPTPTPNPSPLTPGVRLQAL